MSQRRDDREFKQREKADKLKEKETSGRGGGWEIGYMCWTGEVG